MPSEDVIVSPSKFRASVEDVIRPVTDSMSSGQVYSRCSNTHIEIFTIL
jgi:hypothetical protein